MSSALERRLQRSLGRLPQPTREATRRARTAALATLPEQELARGLGLAFAGVAIVVALGIGAASLAATGNLHVQLGREQPRLKPAPTHLQVPSGTNGIAVVAGGKLWLATRLGLRIEGMAVSAAELSPRALYAAAGVGTALVALAPGRRAWTHATGGRVTAIAWSPDGLKIAYVVRRRGQFQLRLIEGDGDHDRLLYRNVAAVKPSWRSDSLAVAYLGGGGGKAKVYDLGADRSRSFATSSCGGRARAVAYAPGAHRLALAGTRGLVVISRWSGQPSCVPFDHRAGTTSLTWLSDSRLVTSDNPLAGTHSRSTLHGYGWRPRRGLVGDARSFTRVRLLAGTASPRGRRVALAVRVTRGVVRVYLTAPPASDGQLQLGRPTFRVTTTAARVTISWR